MPTTFDDLIVSCRTLSGDGSLDNLKRFENLNNTELGNVVDGSNKLFYVSNMPITPNGIQRVVVDNTQLTPDQWAENDPLGELTLVTAPASSIFSTYYYYLFPDTVWTELVASAVERVNLSTGDPETDVPNIPDGMLACVKVYANAFFCLKTSSQTGLWYNQRLQERVDDQDNIASKYAKMAEDRFKRGDSMLAAYYTDRNLVASFAIVEHQPKPYTPVR